MLLIKVGYLLVAKASILSQNLFISIEQVIEATEVELLLEIYLTNKGSCTKPFCIASLRLDILNGTVEDKSQASVEVTADSCSKLALNNLAVLSAGKELPIPKEG